MSIISSILDLFPSFISGSRLIDGGDLQTLVNQEFSSKSGIVALAGGASAAASPQLQAMYNRVDTVAADGDSVALGLAIPGAEQYVENNGGHTLKVYAQTQNPNNPSGAADLITAYNGLSGAAAASQNQLTTVGAWYICAVMGVWKQVLGT